MSSIDQAAVAETGRSGRPADIMTAISWLVLVTVMFGGYSLLGLLTSVGISPFEEQFFSAGHAHAGVLVAIGIIYVQSTVRAGLSPRGQVLSFVTYFVGTLLLSGSFFYHMIFGEPGVGSFGTNVLAPVGSLLIAGAIVWLAYCLIVNRVGSRKDAAAI